VTVNADELRTLCEAAVEGRLTAEQSARLEELTRDDPAALRQYVEYLAQHAALTWAAADPAILMECGPGTDRRPAARPGRGRFWRRLAPVLALAAVVVVAVGFWALGTPAGQRPFATLAAGNACKWDGGTLPTEPGARLGAGRLRLAEGVAKVVFDPGAEVTIEGPAEIELVSPAKCVLRAGRLVARVPPPAVGFVVDTPSAVLTDFGTEFGVVVRPGRADDVQVFEGRVDGRHRTSGRTEEMRTGRSVRFGTDGFADFDPHDDRPEDGPPPAPGRRVVRISTVTGRGKDAYVQPKYPSEHHSEVLLLVKNTATEKSDYIRKAYLGFDLTGLNGAKVRAARLALTFAPTGMGFASEVPDCEFAVHGLTDEALDGWDEEKVRWATAPANAPGGADLDPTKTTLLGTFRLAQGVQSGVFGVEGTALVDFLNRDTNGLATVIVVRRTPGSGRSDLVHGFAGKDHPGLPPPTLRLEVDAGR
jgi:hypothetical protein